MLIDTKEEVIAKLQKKIDSLEKDINRYCSEPKVVAQMEIAISNLYRALAILYAS